ncbi:MAG: hypothetical protein RSE57_00070 [Clostridia bacterium]
MEIIKRINSRNIIITFIMFLLAIVLSKDIYGYGLNYVTKVEPSGDGYILTIREVVQASGQAMKEYEGNSPNWLTSKPDTTGGKGYFSNKQLILHTNVVSNYSGGDTNIYFDSSSTSITTDTANFNNFSGHWTQIAQKQSEPASFANEMRINVGDGVVSKKWKVTSDGVKVTDWEVRSDKVNEIIAKYPGRIDENGNMNIIFSFNVSQADSRYGNEWSGYAGYHLDMDTAWKIYYSGVGAWNAGFRGFVEDEAWNASDGGTWKAGASAANMYDNNLVIPTAEMKPREVYVRHFNKKTGEVIPVSDPQQVLIDKAGNRSKKLGDENPNAGLYSEYYKIKISQNLEASRYRLYAQDGKEYKLIEGKRTTAESIESARNNINDRNKTVNFTSTSTTTPTTNKADVTLIDFYYDVDDVVPPTPEVQTEALYNGKIGTDGCDTTYTPSGENIKPYIVTPKYYLKNLKYEITQDGRFVLSDFVMYKLQAGRFANNTSPDEGIQGRIIGPERTTIFNNLPDGRSNDFPLELTNLNNTFNDEAMKLKNTKYANVSSLPTQDQIDKDLGVKNKSNYTNKDNFKTQYNVPYDKYNGIRQAKGAAVYSEYNLLNGSDSLDKKVYDTANRKYVNVYTPVTIGTVNIKSSDIIDHTTSGASSSNILQKNADFTVSVGKAGNAQIYPNLNTAKYIDCYYLVFNLDVQLVVPTRVRVGNADVVKGVGEIIAKGNAIRVEKNPDGTATFTGKATNNKTTGDIVDQISSSITVIAASYNVPDAALTNAIISQESGYLEGKISSTTTRKYINNGSILYNWPEKLEKDVCNSKVERKKNHGDFGTTLEYKNMVQDAYYYAKTTVVTENIGRIYDFKVTDCTDVNFKDVFRKESSGAAVNALTGNVYYSGVKALQVYTDDINTLTSRDNIYVPNSSIRKIIPLGPYKHVSGQYIQAPKMGYRISFDLKTSGVYNAENAQTQRKIVVTPSYYYISKDGSQYSSKVDLYYKDESGKYKNFKDSGYKISFKPNDGYRSIYNKEASDLKTMSDKLETINISKSFDLTKEMMSSSDNKFIQAWYGEFKLPNSTVAVGGFGSSINNPLKNGYIGVKFDLVAVSGKDGKVKISYNQNNRDKDKKEITNTTEWDYEGYLGIKSGEAVSPSNMAIIPLENAEWKITDQAKYNEIKGTVALFDLDNRAANDFE